MRSLSSTLLAAQRSASGSPYVRVEVVERVGGVARLMWERIYEGSEGDHFHAAAIAGIGGTEYIYRMMVDPDTGELKYQCVEADESSDFSGWSSYSPTVDAYAVACCGCDQYQYGFRMFRVDPNGHIYRRRYNGAWNDMGDVGGDQTFRLAACFKDGDNQVLLYSDGTDIYSALWVSGGGWGSFNKWTNSLAAVTGIAVCYVGDYNVVVAGTDADGRAGVWTCVFGDGYSAAVGTWTSLHEFAIAESGSGVSFHFPALSYPDVFRLFYVESYSGDEAYSRPYWSHSLPAADFISNLWREPVPFDLTTTHGLALGYHGSCAWLSRPDGVWRAPLVPASVELTGDVLEVKASARPFNGGVEIALRNDDGRYNSIGAEGDYEAIKEGSEVLLSFGYRTPAGDETGGLEPTTWITGWDYVTRCGSSRFVLRGGDGWSLLYGWRARRQYTWEQGDKNVFQILAFLFARAGLELSSFSTSSAVVNQYPTFTIHPGESASTAVRRLLGAVPDVLLFVGDCGYIKNPSPGEASAYSYGSDHAVIEGRYSSSAPAANRVQVYGDGVVTEDWDWERIALVYDRLAQASDVNLDSAAQAHQRGEAVLREAQRSAAGGHIVVPMNCGQDLFDFIDIDSPQAGMDGAKRRVVSTMRLWIPKESRYTLTIGLEAV